MFTKIVLATSLSCFCLAAAAQVKQQVQLRDSVRLINQPDKRIDPKLIDAKIVDSKLSKLLVNYQFEDDAVKVVVLMHGITGDEIDTDPPTTGYYTAKCSTNTIKHVKAYFGYHFIVKMMGYNGSVSANPELARNSSNHPTIESLSGKTMRNPGEFYQQANSDGVVGDHIYRLTSSNSREKLYVMLVPRNGTIRMMAQADDAAKKIYDYYKEMERVLGTSKIQLYLVCHSGGGIVSRMLMKPNIRFDGSSLDEEKAAFVRNRTVCVTTMSTPHEGSPLPSKIISIKNDARTADSAKARLLRCIPFFDLVPGFTFPGLVRDFNFVDFVTGIPNFEIRASRDNMAREFILDFNNGEGDPQYALRGDGSKIPVYCFGGRRPTGPYYTSISQDAFGNIPQYFVRRGSTIELLDKMQVMYILGVPAAHYVLHAIDAPGNDPLNWGATPAGQAAKFDRVKWGGKTPAGVFQPYTFVNGPAAVMPMIYCLDGTDGEVDTDGFVDYASAVGFKMGKSENEYFDHTRGGSFYRIYNGPFEQHNHGTIAQDQAVGQYVLDNIIKVAGPYPQVAGTTSTWTK
jgi:predicted alpha/beta hydrolase family esterase